MERGNKTLSTEELEWLQLRKDLRSEDDESNSNKFVRKFQENPLVPIGSLATIVALSYGLWSFRQGRAKMSQYMMRMRIAAQGFTVFALVVGIGITAAKKA